MPADAYRRNFAVLTFDGLLFFLGMIFISYEAVLPVFLARLGAPRIAIAVVPVAIVLGVNIPSLFSAPLVEQLERKRPFVLRYALWQRIPWAVTAAAIPILAIGNPGVLIALILVCVIVATVAAGLLIPAFFDIVAGTIPVDRRGTLFALRSVLSYLFGIGGGFLVRLILERVAFPVNYALLYAIATVILTAGMIVFAQIRESPSRAPAPDSLSNASRISRVTGLLRTDAHFRAYIVARVFMVLSFAGTSFFPIYLVERFGLPDSESGVFAIITAATFVIVNPVFGRIGNRVGYKPVMVVSYGALGVAAVLGFVGVETPWAYALVACTAVGQSVNLLAWNMTVEFAPPGQVPTYIGVSGFLIGIVAPLAILTGVVVDVFGFNGLFVMTGFTAAAGGIIMGFGVREPRVRQRRLNQPDVPI